MYMGSLSSASFNMLIILIDHSIFEPENTKQFSSETTLRDITCTSEPASIQFLAVSGDHYHIVSVIEYRNSIRRSKYLGCLLVMTLFGELGEGVCFLFVHF